MLLAHVREDARVHAVPQEEERVPKDVRLEDGEAEVRAQGLGEELEGRHFPPGDGRLEPDPLGRLPHHDVRELGLDQVLANVAAQDVELLGLVLPHSLDLHHRGGQRRDESTAEEQSDQHAEHVVDALDGVGAHDIYGAQRELRDSPVEGRHVL
eukprot:35597-Heterocapsa_arctica.AAC.1